MSELSVTFFKDIEPQETQWIWYPYIPKGKLTIMQGDPGEGKSTLALHLAAAVSMGKDFPEPKEVVRRFGLVLYQNAEDGLSDTVRPRLEKAHANCDMIFTLNEGDEMLSLIDPRLHEVIRRVRPDLVILDPLQAYLGDNIDMHRANEIRPVMHLLAETAEISGAAIILIGHMNKCMNAGKALYRGLGSIDICAAARSVLLIAKDPQNPENRVMMQIKNSLAPMGKPLVFGINQDGAMEYRGESTRSEAELLGSAERSPRDTELERAKAMLCGLFETEGEYPASEIYLEAQAESVSKATLFRARKALNLRTYQKNRVWYWAKQP